MDFGDIIYVILAIVFSAAGALGKRKKRPQVQKKRSAVQDIFSEIFEADKVDDPVQQAQYYNEDELMAEFEKSNIEESEELEVLEEKVEYQPLYTLVDSLSDPALDNPLDNYKSERKPHPLIADLRRKNELKRAFIYSEIFKPKFNS